MERALEMNDLSPETTMTPPTRTGFTAPADIRFRKLIESDLIAIASRTRNGIFTYANDCFLSIVGYTLNDVHSGILRWDRIIPPEYQALSQENMALAVRLGHCPPYEKELLHKDGRRIPVLIAYAWTGEQDQQFIGFVLDLTPQRAAEVELQAREEKFRNLAENLPQMVFATDANGTKNYSCQRYLGFSGFSSVAELESHWLDLFHPDDRQATYRAWTHSIQTGQPYSAQYRMRRHDGVYRHQVAHAVASRNHAGEITGWVGSITDIDDQKNTEELLRRTEKLTAAARIAASLSHEINNPLASVTNSLYLALQDPTLSPATRSYLRLADQELLRVAQVTTQTLRFHNQSSSPVTVDISELLDANLSVHARRLQACGIEVERDYRSGFRLFCRADELRQAFAHLIGNAIDAMASGGQLRVRVRKAQAWNSIGTLGIRVTFSDTGHGIPSDFLPRALEAFSTTKDPTGTGLGLWVVSGVVSKHDGRISIRSSTGARHGTTVAVFLPFLGVTDIPA